MKGVENDDERGHLLHLNSVPPGKLLFQAHVIEAQPQGVLLQPECFPDGLRPAQITGKV